jgi:hypothetical protein
MTRRRMARHGSKRLLHCMESPEHWFEDFGSARLTRGRATVKLDASARRGSVNYMVDHICEPILSTPFASSELRRPPQDGGKNTAYGESKPPGTGACGGRPRVWRRPRCCSPELVCAVVHAASSDWAARVITAGLQDIAAALVEGGSTLPGNAGLVAARSIVRP